MRTGASEKALLEAAIVRRREMEDHRVDYWAQAKRYYDQMERRNGRHEAWTVTDRREEDEHGRWAKEQREESRRKLLVRRERLRQMLERERQDYEEELRRMARCNGGGGEGGIVDLRIAREEMRRTKEQEMKREAEEKMRQHFKINNPEFREVYTLQYPRKVYSKTTCTVLYI